MSDFTERNFENYGAAAVNLPDHRDEKYYLTTAISYTNGHPHIGHAYEFVSADIIVRYQRILGYDTYFLTGTDEHGQKVASSAEKAGLSPIDHCNFYVKAFKNLHARLLVTYSDFVRTTDEHHKATSKKLWQICAENGDIYLDAYEGWYNEREEVFVPQSDAEKMNFLDEGSGLPLKRVKEESYFFRMSKYTERLINFIETNPSFIEPEQFRNNILGRLQKEGLKDLSVSRTSFTWGIPVPEGFDPRHVMYVWFDALTNYISGVHGVPLDPSQPPHPLSVYWPAAKHIIGKDIVWFHCVIWPCILMSAGFPLPGGVFCHGFVNAADGRKMSKSYNNTIDPNEMLDKHPVDSIRYYLTAAATYGADLNFSEEALITMHNSELADILGNLVHRVLNLTQKYCDGVVPDTTHDEVFNQPFDLAGLKAGISEDLGKACAIHLALFKAMEAARSSNRFLTEAEPWKMKGEENAVRRRAVVRTALEAVYAFSHFLAPVIPIAAGKVFQKLNTPPVSAGNLRDDFYNLKPGTPVDVGEILFQKLEALGGDEKAPAPVEKKAKGSAVKPKSAKDAAAEEAAHAIDFTKLELRVGRIVKIWPHETAERLYCEEIDVGAEAGGIRTIASGLRAHYSVEELQNRLVVVVCNLKESKFQGFPSCGMVLAAKDASAPEGREAKVELVDVPLGSNVGERISISGLTAADLLPPLAPARVKKLKVWESVAADLRVDDRGLVLWKQSQLMTLAGGCSVPTVKLSPVS